MVGVKSLVSASHGDVGISRRLISQNGLVFYAPLWHPALQGVTFRSLDHVRHLCTVTGATWSSAGRYFTTDDFIACGTNAALNITGNISIIAWVNPTNFTGNPIILSKGDFGVGGAGAGTTYTVQILATTGLIQYAINDYSGTGVGVRPSTTGLTAGVRQQVGISFNPTTDALIFYLNGAVDKTSTLTGTPNSKPTERLLIGCRDNSGTPQNFLTGTIKDVLICNRILSAGEFANNYQALK